MFVYVVLQNSIVKVNYCIAYCYETIIFQYAFATGRAGVQPIGCRLAPGLRLTAMPRPNLPFNSQYIWLIFFASALGLLFLLIFSTEELSVFIRTSCQLTLLFTNLSIFSCFCSLKSNFFCVNFNFMRGISLSLFESAHRNVVFENDFHFV